jgi:energy-coupling factor transport system ATP-binding protein
LDATLVKPEPGAVGLAFQSPEDQLFGSTVFEDLAFGPRTLGLVHNLEQTELLVAKALQQVGLSFTDFATRSPFTLSGGQARRVAIAGVLAMQPQVLLLDEPTAGLDARGREQIIRLVRQAADDGMAVIVTSHDISLFEPWVDAIVCLTRQV